LLPNNILPTSYYKINQKKKVQNLYKKLKVCSICYESVIGKNTKKCYSCDMLKIDKKVQQKRKTLEAVVYDGEQQIKNIVKRNWLSIVEHKKSKFTNSR
jgi:hypothetical protein